MNKNHQNTVGSANDTGRLEGPFEPYARMITLDAVTKGEKCQVGGGG